MKELSEKQQLKRSLIAAIKGRNRIAETIPADHPTMRTIDNLLIEMTEKYLGMK